jgi:serine/threonine protein kinase
MATPIAWPSPGDYSTAIQNPQNCFSDSELRACKCRSNQMGLPVGASGNFAVVYEVNIGTKKYAVRCFTRQVTDQQDRYEKLSTYLAGFGIPAFVDFTYLQHGIRVRGQWYPIVKMEWAEGQQLHRYVESNLRNGVALGQLAARFRGVIAGLSGAHIAHGDLQHGNILVDAGGQLKLVDYDGFYLPSLKGQPPGEVGHPNYQHPLRIQQGYYEENTDGFSALVIYLSLLALAADPGLWSFNNGENLIFKADDFKNPGQSLVWNKLRQSLNPQVIALTDHLERYCKGAVSMVTDLESLLLHATLSATPPVRAPPTAYAPVGTTVPAVPALRAASSSRWRHVVVAASTILAFIVWQNWPAPADRGGDTPQAATPIGPPGVEDFIGGGDANDYYRFSVTQPSEVELRLEGLSADADLELLTTNDRLRYFGHSNNHGMSAEQVRAPILQPGDYLARVFPGTSGATTAYRLGLRIAPPIKPDAPSRVRSVERITIEAPVGEWSRTIELPAGAKFSIEMQGKVRIRNGDAVYYIDARGGARSLGDGLSQRFAFKSAEGKKIDIVIYYEQ